MTQAPHLTPLPLSGLKTVLALRKLRNECACWFTGQPGQTGLISQILWYYRSYRRQAKNSDYRVWVFADDDGRLQAYGALRRNGEDLLLTECVASSSRGTGIGTRVLEFLKEISARDNCRAVAEIRRDNQASIRFHMNAGFTEMSSQETSDNITLVWRPVA